jgi:hypothetical protein
VSRRDGLEKTEGRTTTIERRRWRRRRGRTDD